MGKNNQFSLSISPKTFPQVTGLKSTFFYTAVEGTNLCRMRNKSEAHQLLPPETSPNSSERVLNLLACIPSDLSPTPKTVTC